VTGNPVIEFDTDGGIQEDWTVELFEPCRPDSVIEDPTGKGAAGATLGVRSLEMMPNFSPIEVERPSADGLRRERWRFIVFDAMVVLNWYARESRPSKRHKFRSEVSYERLYGGRVIVGRLDESEVPTPSEVMEEALDRARGMLQVGLWKRDFGGQR
jgi:hypothetical protein